MNIIVLCTGNSCRSQMAHGVLKEFFEDEANIYSAGVEAHGVNPKTIIVMDEIGIDISDHTSNILQDYINIPFDYVFTLSEKAKENCPKYKGEPTKVHQLFLDPFDAEGTEEEVLEIYRTVRDEIEEYFTEFDWYE